MGVVTRFLVQDPETQRTFASRNGRATHAYLAPHLCSQKFLVPIIIFLMVIQLTVY